MKKTEPKHKVLSTTSEIRNRFRTWQEFDNLLNKMLSRTIFKYSVQEILDVTRAKAHSNNELWLAIENAYPETKKHANITVSLSEIRFNNK